MESGISSEEKKRLEEFGLSEAECMAQMEAAKAEEKDTIQAKLLKQLDIVKQWRIITRKRETVEELEENAKGMELAAPVSGILQQGNCRGGRNGSGRRIYGGYFTRRRSHGSEFFCASSLKRQK